MTALYLYMYTFKKTIHGMMGMGGRPMGRQQPAARRGPAPGNRDFVKTGSVQAVTVGGPTNRGSSPTPAERRNSAISYNESMHSASNIRTPGMRALDDL